MPKRTKLPVRSLGSEVEDPTVQALSAWVADHRGIEADLLTYKLDESLQVQDKIDVPAAGGRFYETRLIASITGIREGVLVEEPGVDHRMVIGDADRIVSLKKGAWCSFLSPRQWKVKDAHFHDEDEFWEELCLCTARLMRTMRDRGIQGHILLSDTLFPEEIEALSGPRTLIYSGDPDSEDLSLLLEHQRNIAISSADLALVIELLDEFDIDHLILVDPTPESLTETFAHFDSDSVSAGGYCQRTCSEYWTKLRESAWFIR